MAGLRNADVVGGSVDDVVRRAAEAIDDANGIVHVCIADGTEHRTWAAYREHLAQDVEDVREAEELRRAAIRAWDNEAGEWV